MVQSALGQRLHLAGLILSSSMPYPTGPIETITPDTWNEAFQSSLLGPISLIQSFLPLVSTSHNFLMIASHATILQDRLPYSVCRPLSTPSFQRTKYDHSLSNLLPSPHSKS